MGPVDLLAARYNLSPETAAKLSQQISSYNNPSGQYDPYGDAAPPPPPQEPQSPIVPPSVAGWASRLASGLSSTVAPDTSDPSQDQSTLNYSPNVPQVSQGLPKVAPIRPGDLGSGSHVVPNPERVVSPYGGFDPDYNQSTAPVKVANAGWAHASRGGQTHYGLSPAEADPLKGQGDAVLRAEDSRANSEIALAGQKAEADATYKATYADAMGKYAQEAKQNEDSRRVFVEDQTKRLNDFTSRVSQNEDPDAVWGTGAGAVLAKIGAALAVATGAFGTAFTHGPNFAKEIIDGEINRSIAAQRENVSNAKAGFNAQSNLYAKGLAEFKDRDIANLATRLNMTNATLAEIDRVSSQSGLSDEKNRNLQIIRGQYEKDKLDMMGRFTQLTHNQYTDTYQDKYLPAQYAGGAGGGGKKKGGAGKEEGDLVPGFGQAQSGHDARDLNKEISFNTQVKADLLKIKDLQERAKTLSTSPISHPWDTVTGNDELGRLQREIRQLSSTATERVAKSRGIRTSDPERLKTVAKSLGLEGADELRGQPDEYITNKQNLIDAAAQNLDESNTIETRQYGVHEGGVVYVTDPVTGRPKPVTKLTGRTLQPNYRTGNNDYQNDKIERDRSEE